MKTTVIGSGSIREDAWGKVFGQSRYPADFNRPDQIYGVVVRSSQAHARIKGINLDKARIPGVVSIITADDVVHNNHGVLFRDQPVLAGERVRMIGDPVAAIGAVSVEIARKAAELVEIDYETLPAIFDPEEGMKPSSLPLHPELYPDTNNPYTGAMRGFGAAQPVLAYESQMDILAKELGISPVDIRLRNLFRVGSTTATGQVLTESVGVEACLKAVLPYLTGKEGEE